MDILEEIIKILKAIKRNLMEVLKETFTIDHSKPIYHNNRFEKKEYILTPTELKFYKILKDITDKQNLKICPQVALYEIIKAYKYNDFNRISNKTIDFVITETNLKIKCCIELDDYTHKQAKRIERDEFINQIFSETGIKLLRIPVSNFYDKEKIKNAIMGS